MSGLFDNPERYKSPDWTLDAPASEARLLVTPCSRIEERRVDWLWRGYIPRSSLTLLEGPPKAGKSTVLADIVARVSCALDMPDGAPCENPGAVLMLSDEDSPAHVVVPRLRVAGAWLDRVRIVKAVDRDDRPRQFVIGPEDVTRLEVEIAESGAVLVVVDPLSIYMGGTDSHREQEVRQCLWHLSEVAARTGCSVLCVRHHKKAPTGDALTQGGGSVGFSAAARSILTVARDPDDKSARVLAVGYVSYATDYPSLSFRLEAQDGEDVARVRWLGVSQHDADALVAVRMNAGEQVALREAEDFLRELLGDGREIPAKEVFAASDAAGIARNTLRRAKASTGAQVRKDGLKGGWYWSLPGSEAPKVPKRDGMGIFDTDAEIFEGTHDEHLRTRGDAWKPGEGGAL